jgi:hypothetical protein
VFVQRTRGGPWIYSPYPPERRLGKMQRERPLSYRERLSEIPGHLVEAARMWFKPKHMTACHWDEEKQQLVDERFGYRIRFKAGRCQLEDAFRLLFLRQIWVSEQQISPTAVFTTQIPTPGTPDYEIWARGSTSGGA